MKIIQLTSYPNPNELGLGNTNETYIRIENSLNVSDIFPINTDVPILDSNTHAKYVVKAKKESTEFRVNKLGQLYRDYNVNPGDEIKFTYIEKQDQKTIFFTVKNYKRVFLSVGSKGTEIVNMDNITPFMVSEKPQEYSIPINEGILSLKFLKSEKKRSDSPSETDFFSSFVNDVTLSKGNYFITINDDGNILEVVKKNVVEEYILLEDSLDKRLNQVSNQLSLQKIYYGAPGTGKSYIINDKTVGESVIRTTFHPDSDYSTFVGSYKPTMGYVKRDVISLTDLKKILFDIKLKGGSYPCQRFAAQYWNSLISLSGGDIKDILETCGFTETMATEISKGIAVGREIAQNSEEKIVYEFVEQAFLQAYIQAWRFYAQSKDNEAKKQFLVIEEINRGNCAQIFGDLFQLLDRNKQGFSDYPISADSDMRKQLAKAFAGVKFSDELKEQLNSCYRDGHSKDYAQQVLDGKILLLPNNLYIWATMNTSDQSLFPIDSAFKRRWDWKYMPIAKGVDKNGNELKWNIVVDGAKYDWWNFLEIINKKVGVMTSSEDKKLGFFFCKAKNGEISADVFVSKVVFYLWNDVFKDYEMEYKDEKEEKLTFDKFYDKKGRDVVVKTSVVKKWLKDLEVDPIDESGLDANGDLTDEEMQKEELRTTKYSVNGTIFTKLRDVVFEAVDLFVKNNSMMNIDEIVASWKQIIGPGNGFKYLVEKEEEREKRRTGKDSKFDSRARRLEVNSDNVLFVSTQWSEPMLNKFIEQVNAQDWGIIIEKIE